MESLKEYCQTLKDENKNLSEELGNCHEQVRGLALLVCYRQWMNVDKHS